MNTTTSGQGLITKNGATKRIAYNPFFRGIAADEGIVIARMCFDEPFAEKNADVIVCDLFEDVTWRGVLKVVKSDLEQYGKVDTENIQHAIEGTDPDRARSRMCDLSEYVCLSDSAAEFALKKLIERRQALYISKVCAEIHESVGTPILSSEDALAKMDDIRALYYIPVCANLNANTWGTPKPASELGAAEDLDWLWEGYLARRHVTLLTGLWKAGKTTLVGHLIEAWGEGGELASRIKPARVLVVSEESEALWAGRRDEMALGDHLEVLIRPFKGRPSQREWDRFIDWLDALAIDKDYDIIVFDTITAHWPVENENDASQVLAALKPLHKLCEIEGKGAAVLLLHHPRKSEGDEGQAARGSGALPAFADILITFGKYEKRQADDRRRKLKAVGRFSETQPEAVIELTDNGYISIGTQTEVSQADRLLVIEGILPEEQPGLTAKEVRDQWPDDGIPKPGIRTVQKDLKHGAYKERWDSEGVGTKTDPKRFAHVVIRSSARMSFSGGVSA